MAKSSFDYLFRNAPFGRIRPSRTYQLKDWHESPVVHHTAPFRSQFRVPERVTFDHVLWLVLEGNLHLEAEGQSYVVGANEVIWIPPFTPHAHWTGLGRYEHVGMHFDLAYGVPDQNCPLSDREPYEVLFPPGYSLPRHISLSPTHPVVSLLKEMPMVMTPPDGQVAMECNATLQLALSMLFRSSGRGERQYVTRVRRSTQIARAIEYAQQHFRHDTNLSVDEFAQASGLSRSRFQHVFRQELGQTASSYIRRLRVSHAQDLLMDMETPVKEVAKASGFPDVFTFSRVFKRLLGYSPTQFRQRHRAEQS